MSFQGLISGSECAVPSNPLSQVLKHTEGDRSLQQDRLVGSSSQRLHHLPGTSAPGASQQDLAHARQFFENGSAGPSQSIPFSQLHHIPPADLARFGEARAFPPGTNLADAWLKEQQNRPVVREHGWASEFSDFGPAPGVQAAQLGPSTAPHSAVPQQMPSYMYGNSMPMGYNGMMSGYYNSSGGYAPPMVQTVVGKGKGKQIDFEAAFDQIAESLGPSQAETARIEELDDTANLAEAMEKASLSAQEEAQKELEKAYADINPENLSTDDYAKWEAQLNQTLSSQRDELNYGADMQEAWENGLGNLSDNPFIGDDMVKFDNDGIPILGDYVFEANNRYLDPSMSSESMLSRAKAVLDGNGSLSEAALMLEAAIQKGDLGEGGYEAWILLGQTRNMDEHEEAGTKALMEGVRRAEAADNSGAGMLSLAISFTNESYDRASHTMLLRWIRARFPDHPIPEATAKAVASSASWNAHESITDVFLSLARDQHMRGIMEPDVQIGLGVLFYTNGDYDRAKDCFESALSAQPQDYLLWNRLGSSLSNGNKPEEALGAYREALQLRPTYTRAIYNVGVACLNIGASKEAAEHFLSALSLQESTGGTTSEQLWFTLRRALVSMSRSDLADIAKAENRPNLEVFRKEGFEF